MRYPAKSFPLFFPLKGKIAELIFVPSQHQITSGFSPMTCLYVENDREIWTENMNVVFESLRAYQKERHDLWSCLSFWIPPPIGRLHPSVLKCSGWQSHPCAKVFACGENACTAQKRCRPGGRWGDSPATVLSIQNIDFNRPSQKEILQPQRLQDFFYAFWCLV